MNRIDDIIGAMIFKFEGGYSNHPNDRGGPTNYGITQKTYEQHLGRPASAEEVRLMPKAHALAIYRSRYWKAANLDLLPEPLQPAAFDAAVNNGPGTAIRLLQKALADLGYSIKVDGLVGPNTSALAFRAVAERGARLVVDRFCDRRRQHYLEIIAADPTQKIFETGWLRRCEAYRLKGGD